MADWGESDDELLSSFPLEQIEQEAGVKRKHSESDAETSASTDPKIKIHKNNSYSDVKRKGLKELPDDGTPLTSYRHGYLWVSDLCKQAWCEQQLDYGFTVPVLVEEDPVITAGKDFHLARELEVHDVVQVNVTSDEDVFAVKLLNLLVAVRGVLAGDPIRREIPVFGAPFGQDVFMIGMVDEMRGDLENFNFDLVELKTRQSKHLPSKAQKLTHDLQIMLYKKLFDDLILGVTDLDLVKKHLKLDFLKGFGKGIVDHIKIHGLKANNTQELFNTLTDSMSAMPCISQVLIEYCHQEDKSTIAIQSVTYDEPWLKDRFNDFVGYWKKERVPIGVDIEDAWKCHRCEFSDICQWKKLKSEECVRKNQKAST